MGMCGSRSTNRGRDDVADSRESPRVTRPAFLSRSLSRLTRSASLPRSWSRLARPAFLPRSKSRAAVASKKHFAGMLNDSSCYWVYARFSNQHIFATQFLYALEIKEKTYMRLPNPPMNNYTDNASSVLDNKLYIIGGVTRSPFVSNCVHLFDPLLNNWSRTNNTTVPRMGAVAVSVDGNVYVFGGCDMGMDYWGEVYETSTRMWTSIPKSQVLIEALHNGLSPLQTSAVLGQKIILRGPRTAIAFDVVTNSWTHVSENLIKSWWSCTRAAVVKNMLITCHHHEDAQHEILQLSIRAYDPDHDVWLMLEGIDSSFHENAHRSKFMAVNGQLVIYHMWEPNDLRFSIIQIDERLQTTVRASLLWQSRFAITTIIGPQGLYTDFEHVGNRLYEPSLLEACRTDAL